MPLMSFQKPKDQREGPETAFVELAWAGGSEDARVHTNEVMDAYDLDGQMMEWTRIGFRECCKRPREEFERALSFSK